MKIVTIVGARPQFIKAAPVSKAIRDHNEKEKNPWITEVLVHTGQHYDHGMSQIFFDELDISEPDLNLGVGSGNHGWQTGQMLVRIEEVLLEEKPDFVVVYGDTNSTLAGALAAVKLHIPVAHVEAGLRSFNREMPEEHNRVVADHCSDLLFCPTQTAVDNLAREGVTNGVHLVGDTMYDAVLQFSSIAQKRSTILEDLGLESKTYLLTTIHRPYNTDIPENLRIEKADSELSKGDFFSIILKSADTPLNLYHFIGLKNVKEWHTSENGSYIYYFGKYYTRVEAENMLTMLKAAGYQAASIFIPDF